MPPRVPRLDGQPDAGQATSRWIVSPDGSASGCWRTGAGRPARSTMSMTSSSRPLCAGRRRAVVFANHVVHPRTPVRPDRRPPGGSPRPRSGVTRPLCQASSAARSKRCWLNCSASPNSIRSGARAGARRSRRRHVALVVERAALTTPAVEEARCDATARTVISTRRRRHARTPCEGAGRRTADERLRPDRELAQRRRPSSASRRRRARRRRGTATDERRAGGALEQPLGVTPSTASCRRWRPSGGRRSCRTSGRVPHLLGGRAASRNADANEASRTVVSTLRRRRTGSWSAGDVAVGGADGGAAGAQAGGELLGDGDGAVAAAGAADGDRSGSCDPRPRTPAGRAQQVVEAVEERRRVGPVEHVVAHRRVVAGQRAQVAPPSAGWAGTGRPSRCRRRAGGRA